MTGCIWFFVDGSSGLFDELKESSQIGLSYACPKSNTYVSVSGHGSIVRDQHKIDSLWHESLKAWFPRGKEDPNIALLRVDMDCGEYWDAPSGTLVRTAGYLKSLVTGKKMEATGGLQEHGHVMKSA